MTTIALAPRRSGVGQSLSLAWRGLVQIRHNPFELGDLSFQPIMFVLLFTYLFAGPSPETRSSTSSSCCRASSSNPD